MCQTPSGDPALWVTDQIEVLISWQTGWLYIVVELHGVGNLKKGDIMRETLSGQAVTIIKLMLKVKTTL